MKKIKNIIFDLGNVLVDYRPYLFIDKYVAPENKDIFFKNIFQSKEWADLDRGTLTYPDAIKLFSHKLTNEAKNIEYLFTEGIKMCLLPYEKNTDIIPLLHDKGYKLYILSNYHKESFEYIYNKYKFFKYFDGKVISCYCHYLKPEKEIYKTLIDKYSLIPNDSLFIDDMQANVEGASKIGINTIHLTEIDKLFDKLKENNIL